MAKRVVDEASLFGVADAIRAKTGKADNLVFPAEFETGVDEVFAAGEKSEYDRFWDAYQENGNRKDYSAAFSGTGWNAQTFRPKYDIVPTTATQMFSRGGFNGDLAEHLETLGVTLDFSKASGLAECFYYTGVTRVGVFDTRGCSALTMFSNSRDKLHTVDLLILRDDGSQAFGTNGFINCTGLTNLTVQGVIGALVNLQWSTKLSRESIVSIINALSTTKSGQSVTFSQTAVDNAFAPDEWAALAATKNNWTINLV